MKKKFFAAVLAAVCALGLGSFLTACSDAVEHEHKFVEISRTEPTCTLAGVKHLECECGETTTEPISALGHKYKEDGAAENGVICLRCGRLDEKSSAVRDTDGLVFGVIYEEDGFTHENKAVGLSVDGVDGAFDGEYIKIPEKRRVTIGEGSRELNVTAIGENAFKGLSVKSVSLSEKIDTVGAGAFADCASLKAVTVQAGGLDYAGAGAFDNCPALVKSVYGNAEYLGCDGNEFVLCVGAVDGATEFTAHSGTRTIADKAFYGNAALKTVRIARNIKIGDDAFTDCAIETAAVHADVLRYIPKANLKNASISAGSRLAEGAFAGCASLRVLSLAASVTVFGNNAFDGCDGIEEISAPTYALAHIPKTNLKKAEVVRGMVFAGESDSHPEQQRRNMLPSGAFEDCAKLTDVKLHDRLTVVGDRAFKNCAAVIAVELPDNLREIGNDAFYGCTALNFVSLAKNVAKIGTHAFYGCENIAAVDYDGNIVDWGATKFADEYSRPTCYGAKLRYKGISESQK